MAHTNEKAVAGRTSGLIQFGEVVTWEARHLGIKQNLTSKITAYNRPFHFRDEQVQGIFKSIIHDHNFEQRGETVIMKDAFNFESPLGVLGKVATVFFKRYLTKLLINRNNTIKEYAESRKWKLVIDPVTHPQQT